MKSDLSRAVLWMMGTLVSFSTMAIAARELSDTLSPFQIVFLRSSVSLAIVLVIVARTGFVPLVTQRIRLHLFRNTIHYGANLSWIAGVGLIPLAQVFALEFTLPIWVAILAVLFLGEKMTSGKLIAMLFGFAGVLVILRPGLVSVEFGSLAVLLAAFGFAVSSVVTKPLSRTDTPLAVLFYMSIIQWPMGLIGAWIVWENPMLNDVPWILLIGISSLTAHYCMTRALRLADATIVIPIDYLRMPLIAAIGFFMYGETLSSLLIFGAVLIVAGNYYNIRVERRR